MRYTVNRSITRIHNVVAIASWKLACSCCRIARHAANASFCRNSSQLLHMPLFKLVVLQFLQGADFFMHRELSMASKQKVNSILTAAAKRAAAVQEKKKQNALKKKVGKENPKNAVPKPTTGFMDPNLWGSLQYHIDLQEDVFCRLSLEAFFELRAVCKAWYAVACQRMALQSSLPKPFFPLYTRGGRFYRLDGILTYNKSVKAKAPRRRRNFMGRREPQPLRHSLVYKPSWVWKRRGDHLDLVPSSHQLVANEGLVCSYRPEYRHGLTVHVHDWNLPKEKNHVRRSLRFRIRSRHVTVPPYRGAIVQNGVQTVLGMLVCHPNASGLHPFKLVLGCLVRDTLVYDSERRLWESQRCRPKVHGDLLHPTTGCAACNGRVYITQEFSREILVYDFESASWSSIDAPTAGGAVTSMQSQHYCNDTLGAWNGRILDVVDDANSSDSLSLWELVDEEWRVFDRMPEDLYKLWLRGRDDPADHATNGALLTIHASFCGDYVLVYSWIFKNETARRFCLYNMATKVWQKLGVDAKTVFIKRRRGTDDSDLWDE